MQTVQPSQATLGEGHNAGGKEEKKGWQVHRANGATLYII
jgi:hypothetical protein